METEEKYTQRRKGDKRAGATPSAKGKAPGSARYDLGVPGLVAQCIEDLYRSTGTIVAPPDRLFVLSVVVGVLTGLFFGYLPGGLLYGIIGAALGVLFGAIGGTAVGALLRWGAGPWLRPEDLALRLTRTGRIRSASIAIRRAKRWVILDRNPLSRLANLFLSGLGIARNDLPPDIALANIAACEGIFAESVGDTQSAAEAYKKALGHWPRHGFVMMSLLDLIIREEMWEMTEEARELTEQFIKNARDKSLERAALEYIEILKPAPEAPEPPEKAAPAPPLRIAEDLSPYQRPAQTKGMISCKLIENPGSQISNGLIVVRYTSEEKSFKLPPMPFQLMLMLAEAMRKSESGRDPAQIGWVSINDLLNSLPWTTSTVTNSNVHKLVYKTRNHLAAHEMDRNFIEENLNGCYRLSLPPENIEVERVAAA